MVWGTDHWDGHRIGNGSGNWVGHGGVEIGMDMELMMGAGQGMGLGMVKEDQLGTFIA